MTDEKEGSPRSLRSLAMTDEKQVHDDERVRHCERSEAISFAS